MDNRGYRAGPCPVQPKKSPFFILTSFLHNMNAVFLPVYLTTVVMEKMIVAVVTSQSRNIPSESFMNNWATDIW